MCYGRWRLQRPPSGQFLNGPVARGDRSMKAISQTGLMITSTQLKKKRGGTFPSCIARFFLPRYLNSYKQSELLDLYPNFSFFSLLKLPLLPPLFFEKLPLLPPVHARRAPAAVCWWRCLHVAACTCRRLHEPPSRTYSLEKKHYLTF